MTTDGGDGDRVIEESHALETAYETLLSPTEATDVMHLRVPARGNRKLRKLLEMSEQTCFLHALCRTALRTEVTVRDYPQDASLPEARAPAV